MGGWTRRALRPSTRASSPKEVSAELKGFNPLRASELLAELASELLAVLASELLAQLLARLAIKLLAVLASELLAVLRINNSNRYVSKDKQSSSVFPLPPDPRLQYVRPLPV